MKAEITHMSRELSSEARGGQGSVLITLKLLCEPEGLSPGDVIELRTVEAASELDPPRAPAGPPSGTPTPAPTPEPSEPPENPLSGLECRACGKEFEKTHHRMSYCKNCRKLSKAKLKKKLAARARAQAPSTTKTPQPVEAGSLPEDPEALEPEGEPDNSQAPQPASIADEAYRDISQQATQAQTQDGFFALLQRLQGAFAISPDALGQIADERGDDWLVDKSMTKEGIDELVASVRKLKSLDISSMAIEFEEDVTVRQGDVPQSVMTYQQPTSKGDRTREQQAKASGGDVFIFGISRPEVFNPNG